MSLPRISFEADTNNSRNHGQNPSRSATRDHEICGICARLSCAQETWRKDISYDSSKAQTTDSAPGCSLFNSHNSNAEPTRATKGRLVGTPSGARSMDTVKVNKAHEQKAFRNNWRL